MPKKYIIFQDEYKLTNTLDEEFNTIPIKF